MKTKIIAHRGYSQKYPENTLLSFQKAKELKADGIELDVHMTSDGEFIVHHDYSLKEDGKDNLIFNHSLQEILKLDVGSKFQTAFSEQRIPTLKQVFDLIGREVHYEIELKGFTIDFMKKVINLIKDYNLTNNIEFTSPHISLLFRLKTLYPDVKTGLFVEPFPSWMGKQLGQTLLINNIMLGMFTVAHCPLTMIDTALVDVLQKNEIVVHAANCNSEDELKKAYQLGVDQLSTNNLETALKLRNETT